MWEVNIFITHTQKSVSWQFIDSLYKIMQSARESRFYGKLTRVVIKIWESEIVERFSLWKHSLTSAAPASVQRIPPCTRPWARWPEDPGRRAPIVSTGTPRPSSGLAACTPASHLETYCPAWPGGLRCARYAGKSFVHHCFTLASLISLLSSPLFPSFSFLALLLSFALISESWVGE